MKSENLTRLVCIGEGFYDVSDLDNAKRISLKPIGEPKYLEIGRDDDCSGEEARVKVSQEAPANAEAYCEGSPYLPDGGVTGRFVILVQYYQIKKSVWERLGNIARSFWDLSAHQDRTGEMR